MQEVRLRYENYVRDPVERESLGFERVIGTLQRECIYTGQRWTSDQERALAITLYLAYYNAERPHTRLGGLPPLKWLAQRRAVTHVPGDLT